MITQKLQKTVLHIPSQMKKVVEILEIAELDDLLICENAKTPEVKKDYFTDWRADNTDFQWLVRLMTKYFV